MSRISILVKTNNLKNRTFSGVLPPPSLGFVSSSLCLCLLLVFQLSIVLLRVLTDLCCRILVEGGTNFYSFFL